MASSGVSELINRDSLGCCNPTLLKLKPYFFAIAIILGFCGLTIGAAGVAAYFQVGALGNLTQIEAMILMVAGFGTSLSLFIMGAASATRNASLETSEGLVFGPDKWEELGEKLECSLRVSDQKIPPPPKKRSEDTVLMYVPEKIIVNGEEKELSFRTLDEINCNPTLVSASNFDSSGSGVWIEIGTIANNLDQAYTYQKTNLEKQGRRLPKFIEVLVLHLMLSKVAKKELNFGGQNPGTPIFTYCLEVTTSREKAILVGTMRDGIVEFQTCEQDDASPSFGAISVKEFY